MGLGLSARAAIPRGGIFNRQPQAQRLLQRIEKQLCLAIEDRVLQELVHVSRSPGHVALQLYPVEEPVDIWIDGGQVIVSAKTSTAGPGYHAWLVGAFESVQNSLNLAWDWRDIEGECTDETGYVEHRDFQELQMEMAGYLKALADVVTTNDARAGGNLMGFPVGFRPIMTGHHAASVMGFWDREWLERVAARDVQSSLGDAASFFPWWGCESDSSYWKSFATAMCWAVLPWHVPLDELTRAQFRATLVAFQRAGLDEQAEAREIDVLLREDPEDALAPSESGIGFRRRLMHRDALGGWTLDIPGYFYSDESDPESHVYWHGGRSVHCSAFRKPGIGREEALLEFRHDREHAGEELVTFEHGHVAGYAAVRRRDENERTLFDLQGITAVDGGCLAITIVVEDASDQSWAIDVFKSAEHPVPASGLDAK